MTRSAVIISGIEERRSAIARSLRAMSFTIAGEVGDVAALRLVAALAPDIVILDAATPALNPIAVLRAQASALVIVLAATESPLEQRMFLELGALAVARLEQPGAFDQALARLARLADLAGHKLAPSHMPRQRELPAWPTWLPHR
jgi:DNA-binding NarL/FixJ family response regulator